MCLLHCASIACQCTIQKPVNFCTIDDNSIILQELNWQQCRSSSLPLFIYFNIARRCQSAFYIDLFSAVQTHLPVKTWIELKRKRPDDVLPPQAQHVVSSVPRCLVFIKGELMHDDGKLLFEMLLYQIQYKHIWYVFLQNHQHTVTVYYAVCHTPFFFFF